MEDICRVCLSGYRRMYPVNKTVLQEIWERLTKVEFNTDDGKPHLVCYVCCAHLKKSHELMNRALRAEESLALLVNDGLIPSQTNMSVLPNLAQELDYSYEIKRLDCDEYVQHEGDIIVKEPESKLEKDKEVKHINVNTEKEGYRYKYEVQIKEEIDINEGNQIYFKEERDIPESIDPQNYMRDVKTKICSDIDDNFTPLSPKSTLEEVYVVLEEVDEGSSTRKRKSNETPQNGKQFKLEEKKTFAHFQSAIRPSTSFHRSDEGNKMSINSKKNMDGKWYICDTCNYLGFSKHNLITHIKSIHSLEKKFSCHICQEKFVTINMLSIHLRKHSGDKPYWCELCDYCCSQENKLKDHIKDKHAREKKYTCPLCQTKCATNSALDLHFRKHTGEKPYVCKICDFRSSHISNLKRHVQRMHIKDKKFSCHLCEYTCVTEELLNVHLRKHTSDKPFACLLCNYRSSRIYSLNDHIRYKHTGETRFSCHICDYKCVSKGAFYRHINKHRGKS